MLEKRRIYLPPLSLVGPGVVADLGEELKSEGYKKILVVTDKVLNKIGVVKKVTDMLEANQLSYVILMKFNRILLVKT